MSRGDTPINDRTMDQVMQPNHIELIYLEQANNSLIHVVTETVYRGRKNHLTEKSFKPIVMQQPFIIQKVCKGSLEYLRRYGFKTFAEFWDESYDEADDSTRTYEIGKLLESINTMSQKEKAQLQTAVNSTVEHNYNWLLRRRV